MDQAIIDRQLRRFEAILEANRPIIAREPTPAVPGTALFLTLVSRLPEQSRAAMVRLADEFRAVDASHIFYSGSRLHFTLVGLGGNLETEASARSVCDAVLAEVPEFPVRLHGVSAFLDTVVVPVLDTTGTLEAMVRRLVDAFASIGVRCQDDLHREVWWTTLVRRGNRGFSSYLDVIDRNASREFGMFAVSSIELVVTDKLFSSERTRVSRQYLLRGHSK